MKSERRFPLFVLLYAAVILTAAFFCLRYLWNRLDMFEQTQPKYAVADFLSEMDEARIRSVSSDILALIPNEADKEECFRDIAVLYDGCEVLKSSPESSDTELVYYLKNGDRIFERVVFAPDGKTEYGQVIWVLHSEELLDAAVDSSMFTERLITVPEGFRVECGGVELGGSNVTEIGVPFPELETFYSYYDLPHMITYTTGTRYGLPEIVIFAPDGTAVSEEDARALYLDNCEAEEKALIEKRVTSYIRRYINYSSGVGGRKYTETYLQSLQSTIVPGSDLYLAVYLAIDSISYANSKGDEVLEIRMPQITEIRDGLYYVRTEFDVETTGVDKVSVNTYGMELILVDLYGNGTLYVERMEMT